MNLDYNYNEALITNLPPDILTYMAHRNFLDRDTTAVATRVSRSFKNVFENESIFWFPFGVSLRTNRYYFQMAMLHICHKAKKDDNLEKFEEAFNLLDQNHQNSISEAAARELQRKRKRIDELNLDEPVATKRRLEF